MRRASATLSLVLVIACREIRDAHYPTLADASAAHAITQGWIPTGLPSDARDIRLRWDIETNATWLAFTTDSAAGVDSLGGARLEARQPKDLHYADFSRAELWPTALTRGGQGGLANSALRFYRVMERSRSPTGTPHILYVAVDAEHWRVFLWRPSS
jgi:hypothetical protein